MNIETNGIRIHAVEAGQGEKALVFLHYWGGSSRTWRFVSDALANTYRTIATDHRGWGASEAPPQGYTIADLADDAQGVIEALGLEHYVLVGHSMGGKVAQLLASRRPRGLEGLVLVAPSPPTPMALPNEAREAMLHAYDTRESVTAVLDHVLSGNPLTPEQREQVIEDSLRGAPQAKAAWPNVAMREDIGAQVAAIEVPVLVIAGELDQVDRVETLKAELLPRIAGAQFEVLPGVGHLSPLEAPAELARLMRRFVDASGSQGAVTPQAVPELFDAAFNAGDADALLALFTDHATMRMTNGEIIASDRATLQHQLSGLLKSGAKIRNTVRRTLVSEEIALVLMDWTLTIPSTEGSTHTESGTATQVLARGANGLWRLRISNPAGLV